MLRLLVVCVALTGCEDRSHFDGIVVDVAANCNAVAIEPVVRDLDPSDGSVRVLQAASDGPAQRGWWLLVATTTQTDSETLELWHLLDGSIDRIVELGLPTDLASDLQLRPGPAPGEAWLRRQSPGIFQLWQVDASADPPLVGATNDLGAFPHAPAPCHDDDGRAVACNTANWHRDVVFLGERGTPFIVSVAPAASTPHTRVYYGELLHAGGNTLWLGQEHPLVMLSQCAPPVPETDEHRCEEYFEAISYPDIVVVAEQLDPRPAFAHLLVLRQWGEYGEPIDRADLIVVTLEQLDEGLSASIQRSVTDGRLPPTQKAAGLAIDEHALYVLQAGIWGHDYLLARMPIPGDRVTALVGVPLGPDVSLLQLDRDVALSRVVDGIWEVTKLFPDDPRQSQITEYDSPTPTVDVQWAGPGAFLVHRADGGPDLVRVRCNR
jgi:hypothetical protein